MFKHHKYCVIEVSGLLVAVSDPDGAPNVYLLDNTEGSAMQAAPGSDADTCKKVKITDPVLVEFVCGLLQRRGADGDSSGWLAQIAGTVEMDAGEVQLSYVSQAFIHAEEGLLKYESNN